MRALLECDLLILDDIGAEKTTEWVEEKLFNIIDGRYRKNFLLYIRVIWNQKNLKIKLENVHTIEWLKQV